MIDPLDTLAHYVREAASADNYRRLAARCGIVSRQFEYVYRAANPRKVSSSGDELPPVVHGNLAKLMQGLGLTFAPADDATPTVGHINELIGRMDAPQSAKSVARAAVSAAGLAGREEKAA